MFVVTIKLVQSVQVTFFSSSDLHQLTGFALTETVFGNYTQMIRCGWLKILNTSRCYTSRYDYFLRCCGPWLWNVKQLSKLRINYISLFNSLSTALSSATQHAMPPESGRRWGTECLNTRFPLHTLHCTGYSVKLIKKSLFFVFTK